MSRAELLSAAKSISCEGSPRGVSGITFVYAPDCTGESINKSSATGLNVTVPDDCSAIGSAVWIVQPLGTVSLGWNVIWLAGQPLGYKTTRFPMRTNSFAVPDALKSMVGPGAESRKSTLAVTEFAP